MSQNVVLLCLDTTRYDYFQRFTEKLDGLEVQFFEEARSASTWSVPSHASMFTGELPSEHGFHSPTPSFSDLDVDDTFLSELPNFRHVGVSANPYASPLFGFNELFDKFHHITSSMPYEAGLSPSKFWHENETEGWKRYVEFLGSCFRHQAPLKSIANGVASQVEELFRSSPLKKPFDDGCQRILRRVHHSLEESNQPQFVFANIMDTHGPLTNVRGYNQSLISPEYRGKNPKPRALEINFEQSFKEHREEIQAYQALYTGAVEYTVRRVAEFCRQIDDDTTVILTADHGEQLVEQEEQRFGHVTPDVTEPLLHVPLALVNASVDVDESELISHLDLGQLIIALATETKFAPESPVAAEVSGLGVAHPPTDHDKFDYWDHTSRCVYVGDEKFVWDSNGTAKVYEREEGKYIFMHETTTDQFPNKVMDVFECGIDAVRRDPGRDELDGSVQAQLEELGYL